MKNNNSPNPKRKDIQAVLSELRGLLRVIRLPQPRLLTVEQTAVYLGLAPKTIRNGLGSRARKSFPVRPLRIGGKVLFSSEDLDHYIDGLGERE